MSSGNELNGERSAFAKGDSFGTTSEDYSDEFAAIANSTVDDRTILGEIWSVEPTDNGEVEITVRLDDGSKPSRTFQKPIPWSDDFPLARLVDEHGYTPSTYTALEGDHIELRATNEPGETPTEGDWEFVIPDKEISRSERLVQNFVPVTKAALKYSAIVGWPTLLLILAYRLDPSLVSAWFVVGAITAIGVLLEILGDADE